MTQDSSLSVFQEEVQYWTQEPPSKDHHSDPVSDTLFGISQALPLASPAFHPRLKEPHHQGTGRDEWAGRRPAHGHIPLKVEHDLGLSSRIKQRRSVPQGGSALRILLSPEALTNGPQASTVNGRATERGSAAGWHGVQKLHLPVWMSQPHSFGGLGKCRPSLTHSAGA